MTARRTLALALLLALAACGRTPLAPVIYKSDDPTVTDGSRRTIPSQTVPRSHTVARGDTVHGIAERHGLSPRALIAANNLRPPYALSVGQSLRLPPPRKHRVRPGESLSAIAAAYGIDTFALARANRLGPPYRLYPDQELALPFEAAPERPVAASPSRPRTTNPERSVATRPGRFLWPVRGRLLSRFGAKEGGLHNDGINIAAAAGSAIRAADAGVVVYVGNELRGFGNLVLLRHGSGWLTAYAHAETMLVKLGDQVKRGQVIARVGRTGAVESPQLHFEVRQGKRPVDPLRYLASPAA